MASYSTRFAFVRPRLPMRLRWLAIGWLAGEVLTFLLLVRVIGLGMTLLLGFATTVLGIVLLRRLGLDALRALRRAVDGGERPDGVLLDGLVAAFGALLLIVPGFLANAAGLVLAAPSARRSLIQSFGGALGGASAAPLRRPPRPDVIDLGPGDWTPVDRP